MSDSSLGGHKPLLVMFICFIALIDATQMVFMVFSPVSKTFGSIYPVYFAAAALCSFVSIAGLWLLKRWAVWVYVTLLLFNQVVLVSMGLWEVSAAVIPIVMIVLLLGHMNKIFT